MRLTTLQADNSRKNPYIFNDFQVFIGKHEEVDNYREHKEFLDKLASKEWHELKQKRRNEIIEAVKEVFLQKELQNYDDDKEESESQGQQGNITYYQRAGLRAEKKQGKSKSLVSLKEAAEEKFNQLLKEGEMYAIYIVLYAYNIYCFVYIYCFYKDILL